MSAKHALLGLLLEGSAYPYQLADRLGARLGPSWSVDSGQVYKTIKKMVDTGLIERVEGAGGDRNERRHIYAITGRGVKEFDRWFETTQHKARLYRRPLLVKLTLAGPERLKHALGQLDTYELGCAALLKELMSARDDLPRQGPRARADRLMLRVNLGADISQLEAELKWTRDARDVVSWLLSQDVIWPSRAERSGTASGKADSYQGARAELFDKMATKHLRSTSKLVQK
jgi:DNA-binding PadR family transcriptional regulator